MLAWQLALALALTLSAASPDNDVEWYGVSHVPWQDRRPICPVDGQAFSVRVQAYRLDLTAVRVYVDDGAGQWVDAVFDHDRGPYAIWRADLPPTSASRLSYYFALTDGTDTDYYSVGGMSNNPPRDGGFVVDFATLEHAPFGATLLDGGGAVFKVWAPSATAAYVRGQFNGWGLSNPMTKRGGIFTTRISAASDRQKYKFYFSPGGVWKPDARARALDPGDNYNAIIEDPLRYAWNDGDYQTPAFNEMVMYELHVGTFSGRNDPKGSGSIPGTYADVAAHADHLAELGINTVELMPINEFPTDFSAGYNTVSNWAPEWAYGDPDDLKAMIDVLHQYGIAVTLDIIWNHFSPTDNYMWYYDGTQIYFDDPAVETPWGAQADFDRIEVRDYFADSALLWLEEYHFDGFRMDATDFMNMYQGANGWALMQRLNNQIDNRWLDKICVAEQLPDDDWVTRPTSLGGAGFDSQWYDRFNDDLRSEIFDAAFGNPEMWRIRDIINGGGQYLSKLRVSNYLELHDEAWPSSGGQRLVKTIDTSFPHDDKYAKGRTKLGQGITMFAPGIPMMLQGTEWLEDTDFGSGNSRGDDRIDWSKKDRYASIFKYYKDIIGVRRGNCVFRADAPHEVFHVDDSSNVIAWQRYDDGGNIAVVIANFSNNDYFDYRIDMPAGGKWYELINSQATEYDGNGVGNTGMFRADRDAPYTASITIPQMGLLVVRHEIPPGRGSDLDADNDTDLADFAQWQLQLGASGCGDPADLNENGRVDVADVAVIVNNMTGPK